MINNTLYGDSIFDNSLESMLAEAFENINYTPEQVQHFCESFNAGYITESALQTINENATTAFKKLGVENPNKLNADINKASSKIIADIKKNGVNKETAKTISSIVEDTIGNITLAITDEGNDPKMKSALKTFLAVIVANTMASIILGALTGPAGHTLLAVFVAPITEELAKKVAIKGGFVKEFTVLFNAYEFTNYTLQYGPLLGFANMVKVRLAAVGMHVTTTIIEFLTQNEKIQKALKLDKKEDKDRLSFLGHLTGMLIHGLWNAKLGTIVAGKIMGD